MKRYDDGKINLVDLIGKDLWVKCTLDYDSDDHFVWVFPQSTSGGRGDLQKLDYNYIEDDCLEQPWIMTHYDTRWLEETRWDYLYNLIPCMPLEILSTDEIYDQIAEVLEVLNEDI